MFGIPCFQVHTKSINMQMLVDMVCGGVLF